MYRVCIATVDATRARLFTFERTLETEATTHEELREHTDLVNPARRRPGESDDHRDAFVNNLEAEFARTVIAELQRLLDAAPARRLILCASPRMLGELRAVGVPRRAGLVVDEVARDLVELRAADLRDRLASYGLLPARPPRPILARGT